MLLKGIRNRKVKNAFPPCPPIPLAELCARTALFATCFYFRWNLNGSVHLFMYYFSDVRHMYPFDGKDNAEVGYCLEIPS